MLQCKSIPSSSYDPKYAYGVKKPNTEALSASNIAATVLGDLELDTSQEDRLSAPRYCHI